MVAALDHPPYGLREPLGAHGLEHVVDRAQVEGLDGVRLVGGDEDDRRRRPEPAEHVGELEPGEARHLHVEEDAVDVALAQHAQPLGGRVAGDDRGHPRVAGEQVLQLVEGRPLVVDDQHAEAVHAVGRPHEYPVDRVFMGFWGVATAENPMNTR